MSRISRTGSTTINENLLLADDHLAKGQTFFIPNTILYMWIGWGKKVGRAGVMVESNVRYLRDLGFHVFEYNHDEIPEQLKNTSGPAVIEALRVLSHQKQLHGIAVYGHGMLPLKGHAGIGSDDSKLILEYSSMAAVLKYKLGFVLMNVCFGDKAKPFLSSEAPGSIFRGTAFLLVPKIGDRHTADVISSGKQGTISGVIKPSWPRWP